MGYGDENGRSTVDILSSRNRPKRGMVSYGTVNLSDWPLYQDGKEVGVRVEIVGACGSQFKAFGNAVATAAFCVINSKWFCCPGAIFPDAISMYDCSPTMRHFFFLPPFLWEDDLKTMEFPEKTVAWLLAVPISEEERRYAGKHGWESLEGLFAERNIDMFNLARPSEV
jgi:hypothetical protein